MDRQAVFDKCSGRCAYCGKTLDSWHIDHIKPLYRGHKVKPPGAGEDTIENALPSCRRCNLWKKTFTVEEFRSEIEAQPGRLEKNSAGFRLAQDFGLITVSCDPVTFYFERMKLDNDRDVV